jgi:hypothetical protein
MKNITHSRRYRELAPQGKLDTFTAKTDGCWNWFGPISPSVGYGTVTINGKRQYAHRVAYQVANGSIPEGMRIDHKCHNRLCVNPKHLRPVTIKQNAENFGGLVSTNNSGYRGVYWHRQMSKWNVQVTHNGRRYAGGLHSDIEDANAAAIALRNQLHTHNDLDRVA